jgi:radical SAM-linked protein
MERLERIERKQARIAARTGRGIRFKHHHRETSFIEAVFSRGDRALGDVLERAWRNGARFDGWEEHFAWEAWCRAFREAGVDPERYAYADLDPERPLPWSVVDSRVSRKWLALELRRAMEGATLSVCGPRDCHGCAPFAQDCVRGVVAAATGRPLDPQRPPLSTPAAPGPGRPAAADAAPPLPTGPAAETDGGEDTAPRYRYRGRFTKEGRYRFLSHLDLYRLVLRALRRARIDLVYSRGFNPKPRVAFGPALSVGVASASEYLDFDSRERLEPESAVRRINAVLPGGVRFRAIREIRRDLPALGEAVRAARYRVHADSAPDPRLLIERFAGRQPVRVTRERNGKVNTFDLAKEVSGLEPLAGGEGVRMTLAVRSGEASVRPEEVVQEVFGDHAAGCLVVREELFVAWNGHLVNPMLAAAASHAHRAVR